MYISLATPWTAAYQAPPSMDFPGKSTGVGCGRAVLSAPSISELSRAGKATRPTALIPSVICRNSEARLLGSELGSPTSHLPDLWEVILLLCAFIYKVGPWHVVKCHQGGRRAHRRVRPCDYVQVSGGPTLGSLAPHERLPEILVVPREKTPTGAAARGNP